MQMFIEPSACVINCDSCVDAWQDLCCVAAWLSSTIAASVLLASNSAILSLLCQSMTDDCAMLLLEVSVHMCQGVPCSELADIVTCCQMPWVRVGFTLLLLCGMTLPALMAAFSKFSWTDLAVQLFFAQSYWSVHEMSRAMENHFLWDLHESYVAEYQVLGCYLSQLLFLQIMQVQCQSCDCLLSKASKLICYLPCLQMTWPSVLLRESILCQQYAFKNLMGNPRV